MKPASEKHKRFLFRLGVPAKIVNQLSAQAAFVISHDLMDGATVALGDTPSEETLIQSLIDLGFDPEMVFKFSENTGRIITDLFSKNIERCACCGAIKIKE